MEDVERLRPRWRETFNEEMPFGFEITLEDVPMLQECLRTKSREPLERHLATLDLGNRDY
ncbi:MAG: hypothetical protein F4Z55_17360 [Boseongicola sp. SB0667_bin_21]|nr:hypothetical protein [Boseongicola sp. SB0667_bin_21]